MNDLKIDTSKPVMVTGATGYVANVLIQQLMELGVKVQGTVRDPSRTERLQYLTSLAEKSKGSIQFFPGDLLEDGSFAAAMQDCEIVFHTASPFAMSASDPYKDLVEPAVQGTKNVLKQASLTPSVKRIVLTSSSAAINTDASECVNAPLDENTFNRTASLDYQPYMYSKVLAEQAAWVIAGSQTQWKLVTVNPSFVLGPGLKYHESSESNKVLAEMGNGSFARGAPEVSVAIVDVRDVATAHIAAAFHPKACGRYLITGHDTDFYEMGTTLGKAYPSYPLPKSKIPKIFLYLLAPYVGFQRRYVSNNVGVPIRYDNSKSVEELGMKYRPMEETLTDMFKFLVEEGAIKEKKN